MKSEARLIAALGCALLLTHCMRIREGIEVDVAYQPTATPAQIRTDIGYRVALDRALFVVAELRLLRCDNFVAELVALVTPGRANAHALDTPTSLGEPFVLDLMESAGTPMFAGTLRPPPGRYCGVRLFAMPADEDAAGLDQEKRVMMDHAMLAAGRVLDGVGTDVQPLFVAVGDVLDLQMELDEPLLVDRPGLHALSIRIDHTRWFDGIDFARQTTADAVQRQVTENVRSSLRAVLPLVEDGR